MRNHTASPSITQLLLLSIEEQVEAYIIASPECSRTASLAVDRLVLCSDRIGGGQR